MWGGMKGDLEHGRRVGDGGKSVCVCVVGESGGRGLVWGGEGRGENGWCGLGVG